MTKLIVHKKYAGVSLLEVMIAAFIFAVASLGFTKLKVSSVSLTQSAHNKMVAESASEDLKFLLENYTFPIKGKTNIYNKLEEFANHDFNTVNCNNNTALTTCLNGDLNNDCSSSQMLSTETYLLSCNTKTSLPSASFDINSCGTGKYCIYVSWMGVSPNEASCGENDNYCIKTEVYY